MSYDARYQVLDDYVRIDVAGQRTPGDVAADSAEVIRHTIELFEEHGLTKCLCVLRLEGPLSALDAFEIVTTSEDMGWQRNYRVAFVELNADALEDTRFTEIVAGNRAYPVRVFETETEAMEWLL